jgi:hypothetical protein
MPLNERNKNSMHPNVVIGKYVRLSLRIDSAENSRWGRRR